MIFIAYNLIEKTCKYLYSVEICVDFCYTMSSLDFFIIKVRLNFFKKWIPSFKVGVINRESNNFRRITMKKMHFTHPHFGRVLMSFALMIIGTMLLYHCAPPKPQVRVSQYRFQMGDKDYRIRSILVGEQDGTYNEIIGDAFVAKDYNQDRILDRITLGDFNLSEAQKIYEYGLDLAAKENKLNKRTDGEKIYQYENTDYYFEIRSFSLSDTPPSNEFKIVDKRSDKPDQIIVIIDQNADGTLDEVLKGSTTPDAMQSKYNEALQAGLKKRKLVQEDSRILVKDN